MLRLWSVFRSGGMGGVGHLPYSGGSAEQPAMMLQAFDIMSGVEAELKDD